MKNIRLIVLLFLAFSLQMQAQQDPQYTQYMYNFNVVNPAYAGSTESLAVGVLYRGQWIGLDGAPTTVTANVHSPVGKSVGLGLSVIADRIGPVNETNAYVDFSYTLKLQNSHQLAFGLKAGATFHDVGLNELALIDPDDIFFSQNVSKVTPNIGAGVYLSKPNVYYLSASVPNILESIHLDKTIDGQDVQYGSEVQHLFAAAGVVFDLSENFKLKPHALYKTAIGTSSSTDMNLNLFMYDTVEIGMGYRLEDSFSGMINFMVTPQLRIGYAYDAITSDLDQFANSSHEIFLNFNLSFNKKVSRSPRYF
jgi:type IX secretion system PorP/SprF family membrane protein